MQLGVIATGDLGWVSETRAHNFAGDLICILARECKELHYFCCYSTVPGQHRITCGVRSKLLLRIIDPQLILLLTIVPVCMSTYLFESHEITYAALMHDNADLMDWSDSGVRVFCQI